MDRSPCQRYYPSPVQRGAQERKNQSEPKKKTSSLQCLRGRPVSAPAQPGSSTIQLFIQFIGRKRRESQRETVCQMPSRQGIVARKTPYRMKKRPTDLFID